MPGVSRCRPRRASDSAHAKSHVRITVIAVGRVKETGLREVLDEYYLRARRHWGIDEVELRDAPAERVAADMRKRLPPGARVVALEVTGKALSSEAFARFLERAGSTGKGAIAFVIGGADGLPRAIVDAADDKISLSAMTLPHRLARIMLAEQIYRATTILRGEPYAR